MEEKEDTEGYFVPRRPRRSSYEESIHAFHEGRQLAFVPAISIGESDHVGVRVSLHHVHGLEGLEAIADGVEAGALGMRTDAGANSLDGARLNLRDEFPLREIAG